MREAHEASLTVARASGASEATCICIYIYIYTRGTYVLTFPDYLCAMHVLVMCTDLSQLTYHITVQRLSVALGLSLCGHKSYLVFIAKYIVGVCFFELRCYSQ
jgi:hypothetical protein